MKKTSYSIQLTYDISDTEKMYAEQALSLLDYLLSAIENFVAHLDMMYLPFKENKDITSEQIWKFRATFRKYRDQAKENWANVQMISLKVVRLMNNFMSDTQVEKIMRSFDSSMEDVTKKLNDFVLLFKNLQSQEFKNNAVETLDLIKAEVDEFKEIIEGRVQVLLEKDILGKKWLDSLDSDKQEQTIITTEPPKPYEVTLFEQRQNSLKKEKD